MKKMPLVGCHVTSNDISTPDSLLYEIHDTTLQHNIKCPSLAGGACELSVVFEMSSPPVPVK